MEISVYTDQRFFRTPDGNIWSKQSMNHAFCQRYLAVFDAVQIVGRVADIAHLNEDWHLVNGDGVTVRALPYYLGPFQYVTQARAINRAVHATITPGQAYILRVPSQIGSIAAKILTQQHLPFALEVCGDPYDVFAPGVVNHPLRAFFRRRFARNLRQQCQQAVAVSYVTKQTLQQRYPAAQAAFTTYYSSLELPAEAFVTEPRTYHESLRSICLVTIGSLAQFYKAPDVLIDAVGICRQDNLDCQLVFLGDGKYRPALEHRVQAANLTSYISFLGQLPAGEAVRAELDKADLFVLPSRTEGLPRAMIEAMARGLPCIGSTVGGIPELLPLEDMVPPGDAAALASKIQEVVATPARMTAMAARNLTTAQNYADAILQKRRTEFYTYVKAHTVP